MVNYSLDTNEREKVYFILAVLSIVISPYLNDQIGKITQVDLIAPSTMVIFLILVPIYSNYVWRFASLLKISDIPNLNGKYTGSIIRNDGEKLELHAVICQTWQRIDFVLESEGTTGTTQTAGFFIENKQLKKLKIIYSVSPTKASTEKFNLYGEGVDNFRIRTVDENLVLEGISYSSKLRSGEIVLQKQK